MVRAQMSLAAGMVAVCLLAGVRAAEPTNEAANTFRLPDYVNAFPSLPAFTHDFTHDLDIPMQLGCLVDSDQLVQRTYAISDLIVPHDPHFVAPGQSLSAVLDRTNPPQEPAEKKPAPVSPEEMLIKMIVNTIEPRSWSDMGGPGTVDYFPLGRALVINQTTDIQEQVAELLAALRRQATAEVSIETRIIDVSAKQVRVLKRQLGIQELNEEVPALLDAAQTNHLLELVQAERSARVLQAPRLTLLNGQAGNCTIDQTADTSFHLGLRGVIALDGNSMNVHVIASLTRHAAESEDADCAYWKVDQKVIVPNRQTALFLAERPGSSAGRRVLVMLRPEVVKVDIEVIQPPPGVGLQSP